MKMAKEIEALDANLYETPMAFIKFVFGKALKERNLQLSNVEVILEDVTKLEMEATFDRIIVVELLEHMKNFELFLRRVAKWMNHDSLLFVEHICHKTLAYEYEVVDDDDWYTNLSFPSGTLIMPSASLLLYFQEDVSVVDHWIFNGKNFGLTHEAWLKNLDSNMDEIKKLLESSTGSEEEAMKMIIHWRNSFMAGSELFLYNDGEEWMGSRVVFKKK